MYHTSDFDFELPHELIASHPLEQRDASRMLVVKPGDDKKFLQDKNIWSLLNFIRPGDVIVFNETRVVPVRFMADKHEITLHTRVSVRNWWGFCKSYTKIKRGSSFTLADGTPIKILKVDKDSGLLVHFYSDNVYEILERCGKLPLPPYIKREEELEDRERYQTVYSKHLGSMAAPTAGLHFTRELMQKIKRRGVKLVRVILHIGAGTWMPVKTENLNEHKMHSEWCCITQEQVDKINKAKRVIAVGTTSLRTLEAAHKLLLDKIAEARTKTANPENTSETNDAPMAKEAASVLRGGKIPRVMRICQNTDIFITPGYEFGATDLLLTNFHLPKSTLFMLVSAFSGFDEMKAAYAHAIEEKYRFFSYGDCCLLFRKGLKEKPKVRKPRIRPQTDEVAGESEFNETQTENETEQKVKETSNEHEKE